MIASTIIQKIVGQHDDIEAIQRRATECADELSRTGIEQATLKRSLHDFEKSNDVRSADEVAAKLEATYKTVERLRTRQSAIASALEDAKSERAKAEKTERVADLKIKLTKAAAIADKASENVITTMIDLSTKLSQFRKATTAERSLFEEQECASGTPWSPETSGRRSLMFCEEAARRRADCMMTEAVNVPAK